MKIAELAVLLLLLVVPSMAEVELGPIVIDDANWELSLVAGTAFPTGVFGGAVSYRALANADDTWGAWLDLGARWDGGAKPDVFVGASTNLTSAGSSVDVRAGAGYMFGEDLWFLYSRIPLNIGF